jgi:thioester reductase-like protein
MLTKELDTIIHCAASVNFNDHLCEVAATNVVGASELIKLLDGDRRGGDGRTFVHVSTCYVGCVCCTLA